MSSKRLSRASISTLSVEYNVSFSISCTSACLNQSWPVFNIQEYCNLFFSANFNIRIPLQNVLTQKISFIFLLSFLTFSMYYKFSVIKVNVFINLFLAIVIMPTKLTCLTSYITYFKEQLLYTIHCKNIYRFSVIQDNFAALHIIDFWFH